MSTKMTLQQALALGAKGLTGKRFRHTLGVILTAEDLAMAHGFDPQRLKLAAALHDLAKDIPLEEQLKLARRWGLITHPNDESSPHILHGRIAAYWLERYTGIEDKLILKAVANHTLGSPEMTEFEMIIYSADMVEPSRKFPEVDKLRNALYHNIVQGTLACVEHTLKYLELSNRPVHPLSIETYDYLQRRIRVGNY